jgi:hypothetical protein
MTAALATSVLVALLALVAACGGGSTDNTFEGDGFSFTYPGDWITGDTGAWEPPGPAVAISYPGPEEVEEREELLFVAVFPNQKSVTEDNLDDSLEEIAADQIRNYEGLTAGPTAMTVDGLPAGRVEAAWGNTRLRTTIVFDGTTWYVIRCEFVPARAEKMKPGCDQVVESFQIE